MAPNKTMLSGVTHTSKRGLPKCVLQDKVKNDNDVISVCGTVKAAILEGDRGAQGLVAMSVYDQKPVHFLSMTCESIKWVLKKRPVWNPDRRAMVDVTYLRLNLIDDCNNKMNAVDISDQLRNQYRMTHWLRNRKWWWSIFMWGMGVLLTNAYKVYTRTMDLEGVPKSQRLSHYLFLLSVATAWIDRSETDIRHVKRTREKKRRHEENEQSQTHTPPPPHAHGTQRSALVTASPASSTKPSKAPRINDNSLHPDTGVLCLCLNHFGNFHLPQPSASKHPSCAMHRWLKGREAGSCSQIRGNIVCCSTCKVNLCTQCFHMFHTVKDIVGCRVKLASKLTNDE